MSREVQVRFCESRAVRSRPATHLVVMVTAPRRTPSPARGRHRRCWPRWACACRRRRPGSPTSTRASTSSASASSGTQTRNEQAVRLHLHRRPAYPVVEGEGPCPDEQEITAASRDRADPAQPDHARLGQLLPACRLQAHASRLSHFVWWRVIRWLRAIHRWTWKDVRRRFTTPNGRWKPIETNGIDTVQPDIDAGHPVPLPRQHDPQPLDPATTPDGSDRGEPGAVRAARRVRRAARGNGPAEHGTAPQADSTGRRDRAVCGRDVADPTTSTGPPERRCGAACPSGARTMTFRHSTTTLFAALRGRHRQGRRPACYDRHRH